MDRWAAPTDEQATAAASHAKSVVTSQWEASKTDHPDDRMYDMGAGEMPGVAGRIRATFIEGFGQGQYRFCGHLIKIQKQPLFVRTWKPWRAYCQTCMPAIVAPPREYSCDGCGRWRANQRLNIQILQIGFVSLYFAICTSCTDAMNAELKTPAR